MSDAGWFYAVAGAQHGPVPAETMRALLASGAIGPGTLVWAAGLPGWQPLATTALASGLPGGSGGHPPLRPPPPDFFGAIRICMAKFVEWRGRATRSEFWWFYLFGFLVSSAASIIDGALFRNAPALSGLAGLVVFLPQLSATVRRLHDTDRSGWWVWLPIAAVLGGIALAVTLGLTDAPGSAWLLMVVPVAAFFGLLVFLCRAGTPGPNRYG